MAQLPASGLLEYPTLVRATDRDPETYLQKLRTQEWVTTNWPKDAAVPISIVVDEAAYMEVDEITDHFTEHARLQARVQGKRTPLEAWGERREAATAIEHAIAAALEAGGGLTPRRLHEGCWRAFSECTNFKVTLAAELYRVFGATAVLDMCAGWADRAIGAAAAGCHYIGCDPNPRLEPAYARLEQWLLTVGATQQRRLFRTMPFEKYTPALCAEDFAAFPGRRPDLIFSSPPYFRWEDYGGEDQSVRPGMSLEDWLESWLFPVLTQAWGLLAPGGHLVLYLNDVGRGPRKLRLLEPTLEYLAGKGISRLGAIRCSRADKRPLLTTVFRKPS
jgi:hypothetical protein